MQDETPNPETENLFDAFSSLGAAASAEDAMFGPTHSAASAAFAGALSQLNEVLHDVFDRLRVIEAGADGPRLAALDAKVVELGAALGSIASMLESIESSVHANAAVVVSSAAGGLTPGVGLGADGRLQALERSMEVVLADVQRVRAQLDHLEEGMGYLMSGLLGGDGS